MFFQNPPPENKERAVSLVSIGIITIRTMDESATQVCDTLLVEGVEIPRSRDSQLSALELDLQHALLCAEVVALRSRVVALESPVEPPEEPPEEPPPAEPLAEPLLEPPAEPPPAEPPAEPLAEPVHSGPYIILPPTHPHHVLNKVSLKLDDWAAGVACEYGATHRNQKPTFPHILEFSSTGLAKYTVETTRVFTKLDLRLRSKNSVPDLCNHAVLLSSALGGGTSASLNTSKNNANIEFECFVISDAERRHPFIPSYDEDSPTLIQWPMCRVEKRGWDVGKPYFLQDQNGKPQRRALATLTRSGALSFEIRFRDGVWSKRCNKKRCNGMVRLAVRPVNPYLSQLKGWSLCTPPFLLTGRKRGRGEYGNL